MSGRLEGQTRPPAAYGQQPALYQAEDQLCAKIGNLLNSHWHCVAGGLFASYLMGHWKFTREYLFEGGVVTMAGLIAIDAMYRATSPPDQTALTPPTQYRLPPYPTNAGTTKRPNQTYPNPGQLRGGNLARYQRPGLPFYSNGSYGSPSTSAPRSPPSLVLDTDRQEANSIQTLTSQARSMKLGTLRDQSTGIRNHLQTYAAYQSSDYWEVAQNLIYRCRTMVSELGQALVHIRNLSDKSSQNQDPVFNATDSGHLAWCVATLRRARLLQDEADSIFAAGARMDQAVADRDIALATLNSFDPEARVIRVRSDGSCGWATIHLYLELINGRSDFGALPNAVDAVVNVDSSALQATIADLSRQFAENNTLVISSTTKAFLNSYAANLNEPFPDWLTSATPDMNAQERREFLQSSAGLKLMASELDGIPPVKGWKEHIQERLRELISDARHDPEAPLVGFPETFSSLLRTQARQSSTTDGAWVLSEEENKGWRSYVAAQGQAGFWARELELYLICRHYQIQIQLLGNGTQEDGSLRYYSPTGGVGYEGTDHPHHVCRAILAANHYDLILTGEDLAAIREARQRHLRPPNQPG